MSRNSSWKSTGNRWNDRARGRRQRHDAAGPQRRLRCEQLEDRRLLASVAVTNALDVLNGNTANIAALIASDGGDGISLREAIIAANNTVDADTVTFAAALNGTPITLTRVNAGGVNEDAASTGDLDITGDLTIQGNGSGNTIIQAGTNATNGIDKVFAINPICDHVQHTTIDGVTVRFGRNTQPSFAADFSFTGGGIDYAGLGASSFALTNSIVTQNTAVNGYGGGLNIDEVAPAASIITITNTQFTNNTSLMWGGGVNIFGDNAQVTISGSTFSNNQTLGTGGVGGQGGGVNIRITNQNDGDGAATPLVNVSNSTIANNTGVGFGGGIDVAGAGNQDVNISNTAITGNSLIVVAGGVTNTVGGGLDHNNAAARTTTLTNVLIANNQSTGAAGSHGGGLSHGSGSLIVRNTTISGNSATGDGGGVYVTVGPSMTLTGVTVSSNRANSDNAGGGVGGGIRKLAGAGTVTLQNTIADGNLTGTGATVDEINGAVNADFSLIANTTGATITGANNQLNASGRLAALANNGGQTVGPAGFTAVLQTHALLTESPALDNGSNALVPGGVTTDQRGAGYTRIVDAADADTTDEADIGALEQHPSVEDLANQVINEDNSLSTSFQVGDANLTAGIDTITVTSSNTTLVPNANINVGGSGTNALSDSTNASHTLAVTPAADQFGTTTITITVTDTVAGTAHTMTDTFVLTVAPVADLPSVTSSTTGEDVQTTAGLAVTRNAVDGAEVTHVKITNITNGTLFKSDGATPINNNDFITYAEANAGLKFTPAANLFSPGTTFSFDVAGATSAAGAGLGLAATATITVNPVADLPSVTSSTTTEEVQTTAGLVVTRNAVDGAEVSHVKITNITNGTLFKSDGATPINNDDFITFAEANAGLKFTPAANLFSPGTTFSFDAAGATSAAGAGLGLAATATITVSPVADLPSVTSSTTTEDVQTTAGLVVNRNAVDGAEVSHVKITNIINGTLFKSDGATPINNNDFITYAEANAGLKFTPAANLFSPGTTFSFDVAGATSAAGAGLSPAATAAITVNPVADTPSVTDAATQANIQTTSGLVISRNAVDGAEVTHFKINNITSGTLFQNDGTTPINDGDFITFAEGNVGLKFTPAAGFAGIGHITVQASLGDTDAGLGGSTVTADITVTPDIQLNLVEADGGAGLTVTYELTADLATGFAIGFYRSADDVFTPADTFTGSVTIDAPQDLTAGIHTKSFTIGSGPGEIALPGAGAAQSDSDYFLLAVADPLNAVVESSEANNTAVFSGVYHASSGPVMVHGTSLADVIKVLPQTAPQRTQVDVNGVPYDYAPDDVSGVEIRSHGRNDEFQFTVGAGFGMVGTLDVRFYGGSGGNTAKVWGSTSTTVKDVATLLSARGIFNGPGYSASLADMRGMTVYSQGGPDEAHLYDSFLDDTFSGYPTYATLSNTRHTNRAEGFRNVFAHAQNGGTDTANLYGIDGTKDYLRASATYAIMADAETGRGITYFVRANGFEQVHAYGRAAGGRPSAVDRDQATLLDAGTADLFEADTADALATYAYTGASIVNVHTFRVVKAYGTSGDTANLYGPGAYTPTPNPVMWTADYTVWANGFDPPNWYPAGRPIVMSSPAAAVDAALPLLFGEDPSTPARKKVSPATFDLALIALPGA